MSVRGSSAQIRDVAATAKVSPATVSRYLNGTLQLPPETSARIDKAIKRLDYRPNAHARRLSLGRSEAIGLVLPDIANPFFAQLAAAIEEAADAAGLGVVLSATLNRPGREIEYLTRMRGNLVDAVIFVTNHADHELVVPLINNSPRVILADEDVVGAQAPKVFCDNEAGGYLAGHQLVAVGHRRIAFLGGPRGLMSTQERLRGLRRAVGECADAEIAVEIFGPYTAEQGHAAGHALLQEKDLPTAIFASSDELVLGILPTLHSAGLIVPRDVSLIGFDDVGPLHLLNPPVTAIRQPVIQIGQRAVALASQPRVKRPLVERLPVRLVERASVAPPRSPIQRRRGRL